MKTLVILLVVGSIFGLVYWAFRTFEFIDLFSFVFILGALAAIAWFTVALVRAEGAKNG